jgi:hypothetical protein
MGISMLSSRLTFITKFIFPVFWVTVFGFGTVAMWAGQLTDRQGAPPPIEMKLSFLVAWIAGSVLISWTCTGLKEVRADDRSIYVSSYLKEISVPVGMIEDITENRWFSHRPVTIRFRCDTEFGRTITFMPKRQLMAPWRSHPVVGELRRLAGISETYC